MVPETNMFVDTDAETDSEQRLASTALTGSEIQVLTLVAMGLTDQGIASKLGISETAVQHHLSNTYYKLSEAYRTQAVLIAIKLGHSFDA